MDDFEDSSSGGGPGKRTYLAILAGIAFVVVIGSTFMGGQVSAILSNVGNSIPGGEFGGPIGGGGGDTTALPEEPTGSDPDGKDNPLVDPAAAPADLLIVRTGTLEVEVANVDAAVAASRAGIAALGGYVSSSEEAAGEDAPTASVTFRIPADRWDDALAVIRGVATETRHAQVDTQAVTSQVVDLGARITNLRASEAALQKIMEQATKIPDVLDVQAKLSDVRGEIERLVAQKAALEEQAAYATLTVAYALPTPPVVEEARAGWDPAADADAAAGTLIKIVQRGVSFGIWFGIVVVPILVVLVVLVTAAFVTRRLVSRAQPDPSP
jgi:uncharacterized protein DUF4349